MTRGFGPQFCTATMAEAGRSRAVRSGPGHGLLPCTRPGEAALVHAPTAQGPAFSVHAQLPLSTVGAATLPTTCEEAEAQRAGDLHVSSRTGTGARLTGAPHVGTDSHRWGQGLGLSVRHLWGQMPPSPRGCPMHCRMSTGVDGLSPLEASSLSPPTVTIHDGSRHCQMSTVVGVGTTNCPLSGTTALRRGRQHDRSPVGVALPTVPGPVRCEYRETRRGFESDGRGLDPSLGRQAR